MIPEPIAGHETGGDDFVSEPAGNLIVASDAPRVLPSGEMRLRQAVTAHTSFLWRTGRRLGVRDGDVEDVLQRVWFVFAEKIDDVRLGSERPFLIAVLARMASHTRRSYQRRPEDLVNDVEAIDPDDAPSPEDIADHKNARGLLDAILDAMDDESRQVFVLFELEGLESAAIAELLSIPQGTVKSRLRRARETYESRVARLRMRENGGGQ